MVGKGKVGIWSFFIIKFLGWLFFFLYDSIFDTEFLYVCASSLLFSSLFFSAFFFTIPSRSIYLSAHPAGYLSFFLAFFLSFFLSFGMSALVVRGVFFV